MAGVMGHGSGMAILAIAVTGVVEESRLPGSGRMAAVTLAAVMIGTAVASLAIAQAGMIHTDAIPTGGAVTIRAAPLIVANGNVEVTAVAIFAFPVVDKKCG